MRCASCGAKWFQEPPRDLAPPPEEPAADLSLIEDATRAPSVEEMASADAPAAETHRSAQTQRDLETLDKLRSRTSVQPSRKSASKQMAALAAMLAVIAVGAVGADFFRTDIVRFWPQAAVAFEAAGREVNVRGFEFVAVEYDVGLLGGEPVLVVEGVLRNIAEHAQLTPPLRASLLDADGAETRAWTFDAEPGLVPPGGQVTFRGRGPAHDALASVELRFAREGE